jgi:hypothetical protein
MAITHPSIASLALPSFFAFGGKRAFKFLIFLIPKKTTLFLRGVERVGAVPNVRDRRGESTADR